MTHNRLADEPSPYLVQHKDNPVHWYPWGDEAFSEAQKTGKPILLSIGYAACHWCHVMAHESFEDIETANVMNDLFINIKLDREERPDIDKIYMEALQHLGEPGGWPLTIFLTPNREPFWGGTYFPKKAQYGRPGFVDLMQRVAEVYHREPEKIENNARALSAALQQSPVSRSGSELNPQIMNESATRIQSIIDMDLGGIKGAPKFPQVPLFEYLWRHYLRTGDKTSYSAVSTTLFNICQGGIYDHLGGGFSRYSVDERWLAPHFEKMLYDNAQLLTLLLYVWADTKEELFRQRIEETIQWVAREMIAEHNAFAASLDADSEGVEGKYYVWDKAEIAAHAGQKSEDFFQIYDVTEYGNWEGHVILNRLGQTDTQSADDLSDIRTKLLATRAKRIPPGLDDKLLTDWNGLMISALAKCASVFENDEWQSLSQEAYQGIKNVLWSKSGFSQSHRNGQTRHRSTADGYANMIEAALSLYQLGGDMAYIDDAKLWTEELDKNFWNENDGGYYLTHIDADDLIRRTLSASDDATPNVNATMLKNLSRLYIHTGNETYLTRGRQIISHFTSEVYTNLVAHAGFLNGFEDFNDLIQIVVIGNDKKSKELLHAVQQHANPSIFIDRITDADKLPENHPAKSKAQNSNSAVYICKGPVCSLPMVEPNEISQALKNI